MQHQHFVHLHNVQLILGFYDDNIDATRVRKCMCDTHSYSVYLYTLLSRYLFLSLFLYFMFWCLFVCFFRDLLMMSLTSSTNYSSSPHCTPYSQFTPMSHVITFSHSRSSPRLCHSSLLVSSGLSPLFPRTSSKQTRSAPCEIVALAAACSHCCGQ